MTQEQKNIKFQPYLGMQVFMKRENCTYVIYKMSDKRIYMSAIDAYTHHKKIWSNIDCFDVCIEVGTYKIV